ncbi:choice-of-anchor Q domain-containing protein [Marinicella sp. W31]|uniref:choice-of-anchor Q domain-containing protein n=1 Tax=Marinicella sp. W31 TaxID=3023713 RepID=UPI00375725EB
MKVLFIFLLCLSQWSSAAVFNVNSELDTVDTSPGDGTCMDASGNCSLRAALMETNELAGADEIYLPRSSVYNITIPPMASGDDAHGDFDILDSLQLSIMDPATPITDPSELPVLDAGGMSRVLEANAVEFASIDVEMFGLLLRNGNTGVDSTSNDMGGGLLIESGVDNFIISNSVITQNQSNNGAGLLLFNSNSEIRNSDISYNILTSGLANPGGTAIRNGLGALVVTDSSIHHNTKNADVTACKATIRHNNTGTDLFVYNTLITHNGIAEISGGTSQCVDGVYSQNSSMFVINSTISNNGGRGVRFFDFMPDNFDMWVKHSIIAHNALGDCGSINTGIVNFGDVNGGYNIVSDGSCSLPVATGNLENTDPLLGARESLYPGSLYYVVRRPMLGSPAIDAGNPLAPSNINTDRCNMQDQRQFTRPQDGDGDGSSTCDIGAIEVDYDRIFNNGFEALPRP